VGITLTNNGDGSYSIRATNVPVGEHAIRIRAADGCGNFDVEILEFCVTPDKAPTPICINQLTVTLMPDGQGGGMASIWATDFIASDVRDCFGNLIDQYSIYTEEEAGVAGFTPVAGRLGIDLDCSSDASTPVRVYAVSDNGSADYCSVIVLVQLFQEGLCEDEGANLAGTIATHTNRALPNVAVTLTGEGDGDEMVLTDANGRFTFTSLTTGEDYTIQPAYAVAVDVQRVKT
ncbi:carboxypeptidase-like regulatory domain-containing protein, partial [Neolewinella lacunae]|uniref:carboxypeptidase-like regulatory domain-containing protein n=1 Tax=Neolewinella lacunae TaxID=1517758 RepID=UPI0025B45727